LAYSRPISGRPVQLLDFGLATEYQSRPDSGIPHFQLRGSSVGSVIKKRRKKMRKHKKRKLLRRSRHKKKK